MHSVRDLERSLMNHEGFVNSTTINYLRISCHRDISGFKMKQCCFDVKLGV
jgi:hypothetical protein